MLTTLWQDVRYGARMLLKNPGITFVVILALALGIGANTAIFSVVNAVLLRPLPYEESDRLVFLNEKSPMLDEMSISYPNFTDWRNQNQVFEKIGVYNRSSYNLTGAGEAERITTGQVSADLFSVLRVNPAHGRVFTNDEDKPGGNPVVVLSIRCGSGVLADNASILNQPLTLNGKSYTVIGVMPQGYAFPSRVEMWVPVGQLSGETTWQHRGNHPGLVWSRATETGRDHASRQWPTWTTSPPIWKSSIPTRTPAIASESDRCWKSLSAMRAAHSGCLFAAVAFVLLIACANIANLLLARAASRQKEMAIRAAMGAGRWRIARQLLTESVLLSIIGGTLGLFFAHWGIKLILYISPDAIPRWREISLDWRVLAFTIGLSFVTGILFGLVPALQAGEVDVHETLKETGRGTSGRHWLRSSLVVVEVATTLVLADRRRFDDSQFLSSAERRTRVSLTNT